MDFNLKTYKLLKIKHYIRTRNVLFFFHGISTNNKNWIKIEQILVNNELDYYRIYNSIASNTLNNSVFKSLTPLINGPIILINDQNFKKFSIVPKKLKKVNLPMHFLCLKLNDKLYTKKQINNLTKLTYIENVSSLHTSLLNICKIPYFKLKKK